ncbi:hypothetical protein K1X13_16235 [Nocardioides sp. WL0053]|uniref:MinD-like ATPase involved in chromosome partitioning or flagellar assembly n=1 Tax=Nocardioides jiangsuensis TaxID=2866161 RepID=A0ABS7RMV0_9ACTN|nr:hypothetical protein [Nocardioides jiangsuensis]MBY9076383.1 hypothetical protein [Nocardioides jiangsuensis]
MALYALASAKGSPGVSIATMALAGTWPTDPVVADLDPAGGDFTWRYRTVTDEPVDTDRGLLSLGAAVRRGAAEADLADHLQEIGGGVRVLAGIASPTQVAGLGAAWGQLPAVFRAADHDVLADCGRVVPGSAVTPVLLAADAVLFVVAPTVEGTAHLRERLKGMADQLGLGAPDGVPVGVAVVTSYKDRRSAPDLQQLLDSEGLGARVLGVLAHDRKAADAMRGAGYAGTARSLLVRSAVEVGARLAALADHRHTPAR